MSDINITIRLASKAATDGMDKFGGASTRAAKKLTLFQKVAQQASRSMDSFYGNLGANLAFRAFNVITTGLANTVTNMRAFETALVGVGKTTGLSGVALQRLGQEIENLSKEIPVAATELLDLGKIAAQLGVKGTDNILKFTETMARLATATDIVGEQGAIAFARIINVTGESVQNIDRLGSSIVTLGNNFAATESQILAVSNEVAKGGARFGLTAEEVLGLSTAMAALGVESQVAGSTTQKVFSLVEKAIGKGGAELEKFTDVLGLNRKEFINLFKTNPQKFFVSLVEGLKRSKDEGTNLSNTLGELGFQDLRVTKTLGPLIDRVDLLKEATALSSEAFRENTSLLEESEAAFATLDSDVKLLSNSWIALTNTLLRAVLPAIKLTVQALTAIIDFVQDSAVVQAALVAIAALALGAAVNYTVLAAQAGLAAIANLTLAEVLGVVRLALLAGTIQATGFWLSLLGPIGLAVAGIAAVGFALFKLTESLKESTKVSKGRDTVLRGNTKEQNNLNKELFKTIGLNDILNNTKQAEGASTVLRPGGTEQFDKDANQKSIDDLIASKEKELEILRQFGEQKNALAIAQFETKLLLDGEITAADDLAILKKEDQLATETENKRIELEKQVGDKRLAAELELKAELDQTKRSNAIKAKKFAVDRKREKDELKSRDNFLSLAAGLANSSNKTFAAIGKAAALTQLAIKTPEAVGNSFAFGTKIGGPITGAIFAGIAAAAMAAQAAQIAGVSFQDGGIVPGNSFSGDNVPANVNSGEMILNQQQQAQLFQQANGGGGSGQVNEITTIIQINDEEIARAVSRQVANGTVLGEGGV